ncbi:MAG: rhodanese-like domain-containing protein [Nostocaceae cyanobacterium]|nr:rhodanese-like domain-containing protein [Nostocaceae cyanobacterium]
MEWIISADLAKQLIYQGVTILDVRHKLTWMLGHIPGSIPITWQQFSHTKSPHQGKLLTHPKLLEEKLREIGISNHKPVIVIGNTVKGGGEEGQIVWMLRTLGHTQTAFVDGGYQALIKAGIPTTLSATQIIPGNFNIERNSSWEIDKYELQECLTNRNLIIIDTCEPREFYGASIALEKYNIPDVVNFYFKDLLDREGKLLPYQEIILKLELSCIQITTPIVIYSTSGISSAFFVVVLADLGFKNVKNYPGSLWK